MRVVGVDPGGRSTGVAVIRVSDFRSVVAVPELVAYTTVSRTDDGPLTEPPRGYLLDVQAAIKAAIVDHHAEGIAVEGVVRPGGFARGKKAPIDPGGIIATGIVFGAIYARMWTVPITAERPGKNGKRLPLNAYPAPLGTTGRGYDRHRHERSAFDVAMTAAPLLATRIRTEARP